MSNHGRTPQQRVLLSHETQNFPCLPKGYKPKPCPEVPQYAYLFLSQLHKQGSSLFGMCSCEFQNHHPLSAALSFRIWGSYKYMIIKYLNTWCSQPPCSGSGKHVLCCTGSWWSSGRYTSQERAFPICPSRKQKSAFPVTVQFVLG